MKENVRALWKGYSDENTNDKISYREWNGDKLAELLLSGSLKEELLETRLQGHFRKSVAMIDHPDVAYRFFSRLIQGLFENNGSERNRLTRLRQAYICLWVLFVWAREADNLEAPFRASEYVLLHVWNERRSLLGKQTKGNNPRITVLIQAIELHLLIADELMVKKLGSYVDKPYALSMAVRSQSSVDVNIALFEQFGRISLYGLYQNWRACLLIQTEDNAAATKSLTDRNRALQMAIDMINNNPTLNSPIRDDFAIEIALFMLLAQVCGATDAVSGYFEEMAYRLKFSIENRAAYPIPTTDYDDLVGHPIDQSDDYFEQHTHASVLYPLLVAWLDKLNLQNARNTLVACIDRDLPRTTHQVWVPNENTEERFWIGRKDHGRPIALPRFGTPTRYAELLHRIIDEYGAFSSLSTTEYGFFMPIFLMACRHFRMPIPPHLWFLEAASQDSSEESTE